MLCLQADFVGFRGSFGVCCPLIDAIKVVKIGGADVHVT